MSHKHVKIALIWTLSWIFGLLMVFAMCTTKYGFIILLGLLGLFYIVVMGLLVAERIINPVVLP